MDYRNVGLQMAVSDEGEDMKFFTRVQPEVLDMNIMFSHSLAL